MRTRGLRRALCTTGLAALTVLFSALMLVPAASEAMSTDPGWEITPVMYPTHLAPGHQGYLELQVHNIGQAESRGPITVTDTLPAGIVATEAGGNKIEEGEESPWNCSLGAVVRCTNNPNEIPHIGPADFVPLLIAVNAPASEGVLVNHVTVSGGGSLGLATVSDPIDIDSTPAPFGFQAIDGWASNADGTLDTQAGSHPYSFTTELSLNTDYRGYPSGEWRTITVNLPPGLIGDPTVVPRCTAAQLDEERCPADSQVGTDAPTVNGGPEPLSFPEDERGTISSFGRDVILQPRFSVFNMVPPPGVPAQIAFQLYGIGTRINIRVRTRSDYGLEEVIDNITQRQITDNVLTVWGVPADPSHDYQRHGGDNKSGGELEPFLTLPTSCSGPELYAASTEEWPSGGLGAPPSELDFVTHDSVGAPVGLSGCGELSFDPTMNIAPDTTRAETPAGLTVEVKVPQEGLTAIEGLTTSDVKDTTVVLPEGVAVNPGQARGLATCSHAQSALGTDGEPSCPNASRVGTDEIETPLLFHPFKGNVYVLESNPPNLELLVTAEGEGVNLKLVGHVHLDEKTGRLTTTFNETPGLPFTTFKLAFSGGAQAALTTPTRCGVYQSTSDFTPWSTPGTADAFPSSEFAIDNGPNGSPCQAPGFAPELTAGSTTDQAGGFTDFSLLLTRPDGQQRIEKLQFKTPEGLLGMISKVPLCEEPEAAAGACPAASQIGHTTVEAGPGPAPLVIPEPGQAPAPIYLTGGYKGAPYGLSIVVPVIAGPFNLGTIVVRASISVDPLTTQLTVTTDPLPTIVDGVPADLRAINAVIDKPGFMFNPTGCEPGAFSGTATSTEGVSTPISSHFQMGSCRSLAFKPDFKVSTSGKTSRKNGASLDAKILYPTGELGENQASSQSNVRMVKVDLPKQLPSRLTTLQKACTSATFQANPGNCPVGSRVGVATAVTPVLPVKLTGPAYFVSYGGAKFPELVIVLQGYGVTVDLHGETFISKAGITSSTFRQVPDVPISSFELKLPEGPNSALAANGNLCTKKLVMPTVFTGQNGAVVKQSTPISVTGCPKAKKHKRGATKHKSGGKGK